MAASTMCIAAFFAILAVGHSAQAEPTTGARKLLQMSPMMMGMSGSPMMMSSMSPSPMMMSSPSPSMMMSSSSKPMMYMLKLTPSMEVPATNAMSSAMCNLTFMSDSIMYVLNVSNLMSPTAAHIHAGYMGANGPVVAFLYTVPAMSPSMMSPSMMGMSSNMMTKNGVLAKGTLYSSSFVGPAKGMSVMDFYNKYIATGDAYVNVHTTKNPDGEIRAQIDSSSMVKSA